MNDDNKSLRKDEVISKPPRRYSFPSIRFLIICIPFFAAVSLVIGVGARICLILFEWGWALFGWAT